MNDNAHFTSCKSMHNKYVVIEKNIVAVVLAIYLLNC